MRLKIYHPFIIHPRGMRKNAQKTSLHINSSVKLEKFKLGLKKKKKPIIECVLSWVLGPQHRAQREAPWGGSPALPVSLPTSWRFRVPLLSLMGITPVPVHFLTESQTSSPRPANGRHCQALSPRRASRSGEASSGRKAGSCSMRSRRGLQPPASGGRHFTWCTLHRS